MMITGTIAVFYLIVTNRTCMGVTLNAITIKTVAAKEVMLPCMVTINSLIITFML